MNELLSLPPLAWLANYLLHSTVLLGGVFAWRTLVIAPEDRCEAGGGWWDRETEICATPVSIAEITGRPIGQSRAEASAAKKQAARGLIDANRISGPATPEVAFGAMRLEGDRDHPVTRGRDSDSPGN